MKVLLGMSRLRRACGLGLVVGLAGVVFTGTSVGNAVEERFGLDTLFRVRGAMAPPPDVAIVDIDDAPYRDVDLPEDVGPWNRTLYATLIDNLERMGASLIVFDVFFGDRATDDPGGEDEDGILADSIARSGRVVLLERMDLSIAGAAQPVAQRAAPSQPFLDAARATAPFTLPTRPEIVRQFPAFRRISGTVYPTLPVVALQIRALESLPEFRRVLESAGFKSMEAIPADQTFLNGPAALLSFMRVVRTEFQSDRHLSDSVRIALEEGDPATADQRKLWTRLVELYAGGEGRYFNFYGEPGTIPIIPYPRVVIEDDAIDVDGKVVFVGKANVSSIDLLDTYNTVFGREDGVNLSGAELAATAFANLLTDRSPVRRLDLRYASLLLCATLACSLAWILPGVRAVAAIVGLGVVYFAVASLLFAQQDLWLPVATPLAFQLPLALLLGLFLQFRGEKERSERYRPWVPEKAVEAPSVAGAVFGVVLRTDVEGSTRLSERLSGSPSSEEEYRSLLARYLYLVRDSAVGLGGRVLETRGDDVMCFWESPAEDAELRGKACRAALEIGQKLDAFNRQQDEGERIRVRIGLHAGRVPVGPVGPIGDVLNTVSRIERANKPMSTRILASKEAVADLDGFLMRDLGSFRLEGKTREVRIVEVIGFSESMPPNKQELCRRFGQALEAFEAHRWGEAAGIWERILTLEENDQPTRFYLDRTRAYVAKGPPPGDPCVIDFG